MKRKNLIVFTITMVLIIFSTVCVFADDGQMPELSIKFESYDIDNDCFSTRSDSYSGDDVFESWLTDWCYLNLQKDGQYCELTSWSFTPDEGYQNDIVRLGEKDVALNEMGKKNAYYELLLGDVGSGVLTVTSGDLSASVHINVIYPPFGLYSALERSTSTALSDKNGFKFVDKDGKESNIFYLIASEGSEITYPLELRNNTDYEIIEGGTVGSTYAAIKTLIDKDSILRDSFVYDVGIKGFYNDEKIGYAVPIQSPDKFYVYEFYSLDINEEKWWLYQSYNDGFFLNPDPNTRYFAFAYGSPDDIEFLSPSEVVLSPEDGTNASDFVLKREDNPINHHGKNIYLYSAEITNLPKGRITIKGDFLNEKSYEHPYAVSVAFPDAWFFYTNEVSTSSLMNMGEPFNFRNPNGEYTNKIYLLLSNGWELNKDIIDLCDGLTITSGGKAGGTSIGIEVDEEYLSSYGWYDFEFYISAQCGESFEEGNIGFSAVYNPASGPVIEFAYCDEDGAWLSENKLGKLNYEAGLFDFCVFEKSGLTSVEYLSPSAVVYTSTSGAIDALEVFKSELELDDRSGNPIAVWELHPSRPGEGYITISGQDSQGVDYEYRYDVLIDLPTAGLYYTNEASGETLIDLSRDFDFRNPSDEYCDTFYLILRDGWTFDGDLSLSDGLTILSGGKTGDGKAQIKIVEDLDYCIHKAYDFNFDARLNDDLWGMGFGLSVVYNPAASPRAEFVCNDDKGTWLNGDRITRLSFEVGSYESYVFEYGDRTSVEYLSPSSIVYTATSGDSSALEITRADAVLADSESNPLAVWELHAKKAGTGYITVSGINKAGEAYNYQYDVTIDLPTAGLYYTNEASGETLIDLSRDFDFRNPSDEYCDTFYLILRNDCSFANDITVPEGLTVLSGGKAGNSKAQIKITKDISTFYAENFEFRFSLLHDDMSYEQGIWITAVPNREDYYTMLDRFGYYIPDYLSDILKVTDFHYIGTTTKFIRDENGVEQSSLGSYEYVEYGLTLKMIGNNQMTDAQKAAWERFFYEHENDYYLTTDFLIKAPNGAAKKATISGGRGSWDVAFAQIGYGDSLENMRDNFDISSNSLAVANKKSKKAVLTPTEYVGHGPGDRFVAWYDENGKLIVMDDFQVTVDISEFEKVDVGYNAPRIIEADRITSAAGLDIHYQDYNGCVVIDAKLGNIDFSGYERVHFDEFDEFDAVKWSVLHVTAPEGYYLLSKQDDFNRYQYDNGEKLTTADITIPIRLYDGDLSFLKNFMDSYALISWVSYDNPNDVINEKLNYRFINQYSNVFINTINAGPATGVVLKIGNQVLSIEEANNTILSDAGVHVLYNETTGTFSVTVEPGHEMPYEVANALFAIPVPQGTNYLREAGYTGYGSSLMDYRSFAYNEEQSWKSTMIRPYNNNEEYIYYPVFIIDEYTIDDMRVVYSVSNDYRSNFYGFYSDADDSHCIKTVFITGRSELFNTEVEIQSVSDINSLPEILEDVAIIDKDERTAVVTLLPQQTTRVENTSRASFFIQFEFAEADNEDSRREVFIPYTILEKYFPGCTNLGQAQKVFGSKQVVIGHYSNTIYEDATGTHFTESEKIIGELEAKGIHFICKSFSPFTITCGMTEDEIGLLSNVSDYTDYGLDDPEPPYVPPYNPPVTPISQEDVKEKVVDGSVEIKPEISGDTASAEMSTKSVEKALKNAVKNDETLVLSVDVSAETKQVELLLPLESLKAVAEASSVDVEIKTDSASIVFDSKVLTSIVEQADREEIKFAIEIKDVDSIKELLESENQEIAIAVNVTITSGEKVISTFGGKALEVHVPVDTKKFEEGRTYAAYIISADGSIEKTIATIKDGKAVVVTTHFSTIVVTKDEKSVFEDVEFGEYYYDAVLWAVQNAVTDGVDDTHFDPNGTAKRGQMVTFLWRAAGCPEPTITECAFTDIDPNEYYYKAVLWAVEKGITDGTSDTTFTPEGTVNRGQAVTFLARMRGIKDDATGYTHVFTDVKADEYYSNAVAWAYENKITDGTSETTFEPDGDCLRGQIVTFLWRCIGK